MSAGTERFGTFVLDGPRFGARGVPVEALEELVVYREIVVDVARQLYLRDHPDRERSLRNLDKKLDLRLLEVKEGSADLLLTRATADDELAGDDGRPISDLLEESRDLVTEAIRNVSKAYELPARFPRKSLPRFRAFGRSLSRADTLRVGDLNGNTATYTESVRSRFLDLIADNSRAVRQEISGRIVELDPERSIFHLRTAEDYRVPGFYGVSDVSIPSIWLVDESGEGPLVSVIGSALVSDDGEIQRFLSVDQVRPAGLENLLDSVDRLRALQDGWMGAESVAILPEAIDFAYKALQRLQSVPAGISPAPLPDGGVRLEWTRDGIDFVVEIEADGGLYLCRLGADSVSDADRQLDSYDDRALIDFFQGVLSE
ncbi:hypothetical protein [Microbacterium terregens]|uniref:Uncharacterized protein n=1 Tax=Microbacterium terregens TaxID=69363 RepID=A0ABV5SXJ9_9MICO